MPEALAARRLLLIIHGLHLGGAELQLIHLASGLAKLGHDVTLCCIDGSTVDLQPLRANGVEVVALGAGSRIERLLAIPRLVRLARRADVVHCTMWDASLWGRLAAIAARRPVIVADHATDRSVQVAATGAPRGAWIARHNRLLDRFTFATVACAGAQRDVLLSEGVADEKIVHIPNGVPVSDIRAAAREAPTLEELGVPPGAKVAMQVGVFRPEKNQAGALAAIAAARERVDSLHLVFVGDGDLRPAVERRAHELEADWVHFLGFRDDVAALLSHADLMLLPSLADAMPMTLLEAMAQGVPVVATDVGDVRATLERGGGTCVPTDDAEALARACVRLLCDGELRAEQVRAAAENVRRFDAATMAQRYSALFKAAYLGLAPTDAPPVGVAAVPGPVTPSAAAAGGRDMPRG